MSRSCLFLFVILFRKSSSEPTSQATSLQSVLASFSPKFRTNFDADEEKLEEKLEDKMEAVSPPESPGSIGQWSEEEQAHSFQSMLCQNITGRYNTVQCSTVQHKGNLNIDIS